MTRRDPTFDIAKGIGILLVLTCHFFGWNHPWLNRTISSFHMPLFFIIAGYFSKSYVDGKTTFSSIKKYFNRLYWPFLFTQGMIVLWLILMVFAKHDSWNPVITSALSICWADVYGPTTPWGNLSIGVVWFLIALLVAKILLIPLSRTGVWAIPISLITAFCVLLIHNVFPYSIWCISLGLMALPFVTIGWWIKNHKLPLWAYGIAVLGWIAAIAGGLTTMVSTIAAIHSATGYADGGIVQGTSYSGDNIMANGGSIGLNAGELVLNRAQQGNIASQLEGGVGTIQMEARVYGEDIVLATRNVDRRRGKGEVVRSR